MNLYDSDTYFNDLDIAVNSVVGIESLKEKSVLVTGATGTIGSFVVDLLLRYNEVENANMKIYACSRSIERISRRFERVKTNHLIFVEYDVCRPIKFDFSVDYIVHAAGNAHPAAFNIDPVGTIFGNIYGTYNLLEYGRKYGVKRLLYVSSGEVYGQGDQNIDSFKEDYSGYLDNVSPRSCYPSSKRTAETLCASYTQQYGLETIIVRPCHTYGPAITKNDSRANVQFIRNVLNGEDIVLKSSGEQMRSYCYIVDCASVILTVLINGKSGEAYNSANPNARITIAGLAHVIAKNEGRKVIFSNPNAADLAIRTPIKKQVLSSEKVEALGWKGKFTVQDGIAHTLAIMKGN